MPTLHSCLAIPLELVALDADTITSVVVDVLDDFSNDYLSHHWIEVCSYGASTMIGSKTGVLTQLKAKFFRLLLWHCMCHGIELAVAVNQVQVFLDELYFLYHQSPKCERD